MIEFIYNHPELVSSVKRKESKKYFINNLGPFLQEFESKGGIVTINFDKLPEDDNYFTFNFRPTESLFDFIRRFNEYKTSTKLN